MYYETRKGAVSDLAVYSDTLLLPLSLYAICSCRLVGGEHHVLRHPEAGSIIPRSLRGSTT